MKACSPSIGNGASVLSTARPSGTTNVHRQDRTACRTRTAQLSFRIRGDMAADGAPTATCYGVQDNLDRHILAHLRVQHQMIQARVLPIASKVRPNVRGTSRICRLHQARHVAFLVCLKAVHALGPRRIHEHVKGLMAALQQALRSATDDDTFARFGSAGDQIAGESRHRLGVEVLGVPCCRSYFPSPRPEISPFDPMPPRVDSFIIFPD